MANVFSTLAQGTKKPLSGILVVSLIYAIYKAKKQFKLNINGNKSSPQQQASKKKQHKKVGVNTEFFEQMKKLLPICVPGKLGLYTKSPRDGILISRLGLFSKESGLLVVLATVLIARTWLDIWFSGFNG
jgi:ATP-binding cassette subfamily D (ALD) protein 3